MVLEIDDVCFACRRQLPSSRKSTVKPAFWSLHYYGICNSPDTKKRQDELLVGESGWF